MDSLQQDTFQSTAWSNYPDLQESSRTELLKADTTQALDNRVPECNILLHVGVVVIVE